MHLRAKVCPFSQYDCFGFDRVVAAGDVLPSAITAMHAGAMLMAAGLGVVTTLLCSLVPSFEICRVSSLSSAFAKGAA